MESREEFTVQLCPLPEGAFPSRVHDYSAYRRIEWFEAFDASFLVTRRRRRFSYEQLYSTDPPVAETIPTRCEDHAARCSMATQPCGTGSGGSAEPGSHTFGDAMQTGDGSWSKHFGPS